MEFILNLFFLGNAKYISIERALFIPSGNKNLLKVHTMWRELIEFYEKNHCLVNESEWPRNWSWNCQTTRKLVKMVLF